jgi:two-component system response regulator HydG
MMPIHSFKRNMLIIDDDKAILRVFRRIFERNGYAVVTAETGKEAKEKLRNQGFDATLVDLRLPDMDGFDLLPHMQAVAPLMVKIVLTGSPLLRQNGEVEGKWADALLSKPVSPEVLLSLLDCKLKEKNA